MQSTFDTLVSLCEKAGIMPPTRESALADWGLSLNETKAELDELVQERKELAEESIGFMIQEYNFNNCNI